MKKLVLVALLMFGIISFAQEGKRKFEEREKLTSEQKIELHVKKMKLDLDLDEKQTAQIKEIITAQIAKREAKKTEMQSKRSEGKKPTPDEMYKMKNEMLDEQIAHKAEMKKILNADQYAKWDAKQTERKNEFRKKKQDNSK